VKIVDVAEFYSATSGGVRTYIDRKFSAAARCGHDLTVIAPGREDRVERRAGGKLIWLRAPPLPVDKTYHMFWRAEDVWRILDQEAPDVVEGSSPWRGGWLVGNWRGSAARRAARVLFMHADPIAVYPQTLLGHLLSPIAIDRIFSWFWSYLRRLEMRFDGCVVAGVWLAERFRQHGLRRLHAVPFGVETRIFRSGLRDEATRRASLARCGLEGDAALMITIGRHHPEKRIPMLIGALTLAQKARPIGLAIVGDGLAHRAVLAAAARARHVFVAGRIADRDHLARLLASADGLLHGSSAETFGFVVAEALCCGTPVVVPDGGGACDLARPSYAEIYAAGDRRAAGDAILRLLARDPTALSNAAAEAGSRIGDLDGHFDRLFALYEGLASAKRAGAGGRQLETAC
jgi:alpha-1,6-mannosyltransferase